MGTEGFMPPSRRTSGASLGGASIEGPSGAVGAADGGAGGGDGVAVRVAVRCRPQAPSAAAKDEPTFGIVAEPCGRDRQSLRFTVADEAWDRLAARAQDGPGGNSRIKLRAEQRGRDREMKQFRCNAYLGPECSQEDVFREAAPIVENVMEGYNGTIFCYGVTGSGKTYTMSGPPEERGTDRSEESLGVAQRVSRKIFEYIRDRSVGGMTFLVEASFLEIYSPDGTREQLIDLLAEEEKKLEVRQDPLNRESFLCEGMRKLPIKSPDELCEVLGNGQRRCHFLETSKNCHSSRSHCLFMLSIESLDEKGGKGQQVIQRGKLMLVDLAGSESLKRVQAASDSNEELRKRQAIGINRVLTSLGTVVDNLNKGRASGHRDSALTMLLRDCLGGNARALLVANIGPELEGMDEGSKTLTFAQQMLSVRNTATVNRINTEQSALMQMRQRHADCLRILQDKVSESQEEEHGSQKKLRLEMEDLNQRLLTKESAERTLEDMRREQLRKIDEMKQEMASTMSKELEKMRKQSLMDLDSIRQSVEQHVTTIDGSQQMKKAEEHKERVGKMQAELNTTVQAQRVAESEASELRVRLASAEERARMLQARQEELRLEREGFEEERKHLRQRGDQQWQSLMAAENELQRWKSEAEAHRSELARLTASRAEDDECLRREREERRTREAELQREISELRLRIEESRREAEVQAIRADSEHRETTAQLAQQRDRLLGEATSRDEQIEQAKKRYERLQAERADAVQREEDLRRQFPMELQRAQDELDDAKQKEMELMAMLNEVQDSIITASAAQPGTPRSSLGGHQGGSMRANGL